MKDKSKTCPTPTDLDVLRIYTDGSYFQETGCGGWSALLLFGEEEVMLGGARRAVSAEEMEVKAVIEGIKQAGDKKHLMVLTDYKPIVIKMNQHKFVLSFGQKKKTQNKQGLHHKKAVWRARRRRWWASLVSVAKGKHIIWKWVKGHSGHPDNIRVNIRARQEARALAQRTLEYAERHQHARSFAPTARTTST